MKKFSVTLGIVVLMMIFAGAVFAFGPGGLAPGDAKNMSVSEMLQIAFTVLFMAFMGWLEPKVRTFFARSDEEAEKRIKLIDNQRIAMRLQDGRAGVRKAAEAAFTDFMMSLGAEQKKDGVISQEDLVDIAKKTVDSFIKAETNSTGDLMKGLGQDLYEVAAQEVKDIASRIRDRFLPANSK